MRQYRNEFIRETEARGFGLGGILNQNSINATSQNPTNCRANFLTNYEFFNEDLPNKDRILINQVAEFNQQVVDGMLNAIVKLFSASRHYGAVLFISIFVAFRCYLLAFLYQVFVLRSVIISHLSVLCGLVFFYVALQTCIVFLCYFFSGLAIGNLIESITTCIFVVRQGIFAQFPRLYHFHLIWAPFSLNICHWRNRGIAHVAIAYDHHSDGFQSMQIHSNSNQPMAPCIQIH